MEPAAEPRPPSSSPGVDRREALRILTRARRLYSAAQIVQARRLPGGIESAFLLHRSLTLALRLLPQLRGEAVPDDFIALVERARAIASEESLTPEDLVGDLLVVNEMRERLAASDEEVGLADDRRYDRAFVRSREWYDAVAAYLNQRLPASESHLRQRLTLAAAVLVALGAGFFAGRHTPALQPHAPVQGPREQAEVKPPSGPAFSATFYRDKDFKDLAFTRLHDSIAFDWKGDAPFGMDQADHFSVRWEGTLLVPDPGQYTFYLTSDDGSRLFIDDKLVVENWSDHSLVMLQGRADLTAGPHRLRVDYFDGLGMAAVRLEWSSEAFTRRLMTSADLR